MMRKLIVALLAIFIGAPAYGQAVQQSGTVTARHLPAWVANGVIGDAGTSADSPITSIGATGQICSNSARISSGSWQQLCLQANTNSAATISLQNFGVAAPQSLQFVVNGTTYPFPGSLANITIGVTPVVGGTNGQCLFISGGLVGQQNCTLSAITSLTGDVTAIGPGISAATLATVNATTGTFGSSSLVPIITVNGKGLITNVSTAAFGLTVGSSTITSGTTNGLLYDNGGLLGNLTTLGNGVMVTSAGGVPSISTTLPSALSIPSPTFTGTETFPDSATWTSNGISKVAALSVGSATIPSGGNVSISGQYMVNGAQIAASNLSNGATGSGAVVLATSPAISGTWTGSPTFSGNLTFSGQLIGTGTSSPASTGGNTVIMGTIASPTLSNTGQAFLYNTIVNGAILEGDGSTNDVSIFNKSGTLVLGVPTGTTKLNFPSLASGTCSSGLGLDSSNNTILISCPGAASSIQVGTTTVTSSGGTNRLLTEGTVSAGTGTLADTSATANSSGDLAAVNSIAGNVIATKAQQQTGTAATNVVTPSQQQQHDSALKAHVSFNGTSGACSPCTIIESYNVSSVTRASAGSYTVNFTTSFSGSNTFSCQITAGNPEVGTMGIKTASTLPLFTFVASTGTATDSNPIDVMCVGRQ